MSVFTVQLSVVLWLVKYFANYTKGIQRKA